MAILLVIALLITGCGTKDIDTWEQGLDIKNFRSYEEYLDAVAETSDLIKKSLEEDVLTQSEMNEKAEGLYKLWDDAMNSLWPELKSVLGEEDFAKLQNEQTAWIAERETAMEEAGEAFEGGSMYPLVVNSEGAALTETRVSQLLAIIDME